MRKEIDGMIIEDGVLIDGSNAKGNVIIPDGVTRIGCYAFKDNKNIISVIIPDSINSIIPDSINSISFMAFKGCINLISINIPNSIIRISNTAFKGCINLKEINIPMKCSKKDSFIGYKKCLDKNNKEYIVKLEIQEDALRSSGVGNKCRCSKAKVLSVTTLDGNEIYNTVYSWWDKEFVYTVGQIVEVKNFNTCRWNECAPGIHFFMTREEAVDYEF